MYTEQHVASLSDEAQGNVGIVNAKNIWLANQTFWKSHETPLEQEIVFASTGVKKAGDPPWRYVASFAGSDIQTNPPSTNDAVAGSGQEFTRQVDRFPSKEVLDDIESKVDYEALENVLMEEGVAKFAGPQQALLRVIEEKRVG